jgi:hypothetical protein
MHGAASGLGFGLVLPYRQQQQHYLWAGASVVVDFWVIPALFL